jgi:hypothetical protein
MSPAERLKLIRERTKFHGIAAPKPAGMFATVNPELKTKLKKQATLAIYPNPRPFTIDGGDEWNLHGRLRKWFKTPDPKPKPTCRIERKKRTNPLGAISKKLPAKLPVLTFDPKTRRRL